MIPPSSNAVVVSVNPGLGGGGGVAGACATIPTVATDSIIAKKPTLPFTFIRHSNLRFLGRITSLALTPHYITPTYPKLRRNVRQLRHP
jgi:hypothetical protein